MKYSKAYIQAGLIALSAAAPFIAQAATQKKLSDIITLVAGYMNQALELLMGFAVLTFVFYVIRYFIMRSDDVKRSDAALYVMWSVVGFFVILSVWGLVNILISTFDLGSNSPGSLTNIQNIFPQ